MSRRWLVAISACTLAVVTTIVVVVVTRSGDNSDPAPATPEPTLWIDSEFG